MTLSKHAAKGAARRPYLPTVPVQWSSSAPRAEAQYGLLLEGTDPGPVQERLRVPGSRDALLLLGYLGALPVHRPSPSQAYCEAFCDMAPAGFAGGFSISVYS